MREIKFRVWDKCFEEMAEVVSLDWSRGDVFVLDKDLKITDTRDFSEVVLMQYTGLKDRYGKDIYEGDIVKCSDGADEIVCNDSDTGIGVVEWLDRFGFWNVSVIENGLGDLLYMGYVEAIGNIHENPELLEESEGED